MVARLPIELGGPIVRTRPVLSVLFALACSAIVFPAAAQQAPFPPMDQALPPILLHKHGVFWAGGEIMQRTQQGTELSAQLTVPIAGNDILVEQAYVEYFIPENLRRGANTIPIVLVPGGGLIGVHYLTTPDGREGWADFFLRRGFPVYIVDPPGRARAGFMVDQFNDVRAGVAPPSSQANLGQTDSSQWLEWNSGPEPRAYGAHDPTCIGNDNRGTPPVYCNGDRMPAVDEEAYKHWLAAFVPNGPTPSGTDPGYAAVLEKIGPAIYIGHSAGGSSGGNLANTRPELFRAYVGIEPAASTGSCAAAATATLNGLLQMLVVTVHGINQVGRPDGPDCVRTYQRINAQGGDATYINLPARGIWGNDHIMMWDDNSDEVAGLILGWIETHVEKG